MEQYSEPAATGSPSKVNERVYLLVNATVLSIFQLLFLLAPICFTWSGLCVAIVLYVLSGLGVTVGLHRLLTHRSFKTYDFVQRFWAFLGTLAFQGGPLAWVAVHRLHHQNADREGDPHSPRKGFWHSQLFWYYSYDSRYGDAAERLSYVKDLADDPFLRWLDNWFLLVQALLFGVLWLVGEMVQPGLGVSWAIYGVFVRIFVLQQITSLVNSASHTWGYRSFASRDDSKNNWWVALLTSGEGWHNNHHAFPWSARIGLKWWEVDMGYWCIRLMQLLGLAWDVTIPKPEKLMEAYQKLS